MASFYDWVAHNPELLPLYSAFVLILSAWLYWSTRKFINWGVSIQAALSRGNILPPDDVTNQITLFMLAMAVDLLLIGAYIYVVT